MSTRLGYVPPIDEHWVYWWDTIDDLWRRCGFSSKKDAEERATKFKRGTDYRIIPVTDRGVDKQTAGG